MNPIQRRVFLADYANEQIKKWRRINNLLKNCSGLLEIEHHILNGDEEDIRAFVKSQEETRQGLILKAKELVIKNYGHMTKEELINAINRYERNQISRQKYER